MPNLPTKRAGRRAGGASRGGSGVAETSPGKPCATQAGCRANQIDRRGRAQRRPNRPSRVLEVA
eukprot:12976372-Alexandrium_andersonii.AAC.1